MTDDQFERLMSDDTRRALARQTGIGVLTSLTASVALAVVYWEHVEHPLIWAWLAGIWGLGLYRLLWVARNPPSEGDDPISAGRWVARYAASTVVIGCIWGLSAPLFAGHGGTVLDYLYLLILTGLMTGSGMAFSAQWVVSASFFLPLGAIASGWLLYQGGDQAWLGVLLLLFTAFLFLMVRTLSGIIRRLIGSRLKYREMARRYYQVNKRRKRLSGQMRSVSEQSAELAANLHEKELMLHSVLQQTPVAVMVVDADGNILDAFGSSAARLEERFGPLAGRSIYQTFSPIPSILQACRETLSGSQKIALARIGSTEFEFITSPYRDMNGSPAGLIMVGVDVSEEARLRRLQQEFVVHVNHQLRTPLTTIVASLDMLADARLDLRPETREELLTSAARAAGRMKELADAIDSLESDVADDREPTHSDELSGLLRRCYQQINDPDPLQINISNRQHLVGTVEVDNETLSAVCSAMLRNALNFGRENSTVEVTLENEICDERDTVMLRFSNQCDPIPEKRQVHLFDQFSVGDSSDSRVHYGLGLGLYSVRKQLEQYGGRVWLDRSDIQGTEFCISLPLTTTGERRESA